MIRTSLWLACWLIIGAWSSADDATKDAPPAKPVESYPLVPIGVAAVDITPSYPTRMSGYGARVKEHDSVAMPIHAKALVIGEDALTAIISVETCGVAEPFSSKLAGLLKQKFGIDRERLVISSTHTHTAPWLKDFAPNIFPPPLPEEHEKHLAQYEAEVTEKVIEVVGNAIKARRPSRLSWARTTANLNVNRRVMKDGKWSGFGNQQDGVRDQRLPVIAVRDADGKLVATWSNYAMHCTVHGGNFMAISGDWAGAAMEQIEADHPGTISLITIGCGADQGPRLNGGLAEARVLGREFADAVKSLVAPPLRETAAEPRGDAATFRPLNPRIDGKLIQAELPFAGPLPTQRELEALSERKGVDGSNARYFLELVRSGKEIPKSMTYPVATWTFGNDLAMVFLGGEVVVDYSLRLHAEFDETRLWVTSYANDIPSYIASKRVLQEGGYEADFSMLYYRRPNRLAPEAEDVVIDTVQKLLPHEFYSADKQAAFPKPMSPEESLASIKVRPGLKVELVASEPLIQDPVAFEWDEQGRLWVVEMSDYPNGVMAPESQAFQNDDLRGQPGGRIKILTDTDGDGRYDQATTFLEGIAFPSGIQRWRDGVLITAAPEIFFAADRDGDGKAEFKRTLFKGFLPGNQQHRVNGLRYGLDNWVYVGNGDSGGDIETSGSGLITASERPSLPLSPSPPLPLSIRGRDLRINPDSGHFEPISGQTQFGRERNDAGDWFGNNNSRPIWHYGLDDRYLRRNPHLAVRDTKLEIAVVPGAAPVFPLSKTLARFNDFDRANRFTSACSTTIYRDRVLGDAFYGNAFVCEPVHNLVSRLVLTPDGTSFKARRAEEDSEFLASSDNWFRPVMVRTGPDGALWVADMYRAVIEHPRWIPPEWQRKLDLRAGSDRGRIYRVVRSDDTSATTAKRVEAEPATWLAKLASTNGWWRDTAQRELVHRQDAATIEPLRKMATEHKEPLARLHAICTLEAYRAAGSRDSALTKPVLLAALNDQNAIVRRHAVRLSERWLSDIDVLALLEKGVSDEAPVVMQLAYSLGEMDSVQTPSSLQQRAASLLATIAVQHANDALISTAVFSSLNTSNVETVEGHIAQRIKRGNAVNTDMFALLGKISAQSVALRNGKLSPQALSSLLPQNATEAASISPSLLFPALRQVLANAKVDEVEKTVFVQPGWKLVIDRAKKLAATPNAESQDRIASLELLAISKTWTDQDVAFFRDRVSPREPIEVQQAAITGLMSSPRADVPSLLISQWKTLGPQVRSAVLEASLSREASTHALLNELENGSLTVTDFDAARRDRLLTHKNSAIKDRTTKLFKATAATTTRQEVIEKFNAVLTLTGDVSKGRVVFEKRCSACHRMQDIGKQIGADLNAVKDRSTPALLTAILDPNRAVESRYFSYTIQTTDGRSFSGMLTSEAGNAVTLVAVDGKEMVLLRSLIEDLAASTKSFMPEGLEKDVSPQDLADLIVFVQGGRSSAPSPKRPVVPEADGSLRLLATNAELRGPTLVFESPFQNLGYWQSADDVASWTIEVTKLGRYELSMTYAVQESAAGDRFEVAIDDMQRLESTAVSTRVWENFSIVKLGFVDLTAGKHRLTMRPVAKPKFALLDLKELRLAPPQ